MRPESVPGHLDLPGRDAGASETFEVHDPPCGHGVEGETLAQVVGVVEPAGLDPGADPGDREILSSRLRRDS